MAVSLTGSECALKCAHCEGRYLKGMADARALTPAQLLGKASILISGGSDSFGAVPIKGNQEMILELSDQYPLNIHVGWQDPGNLDFLKGRRVTVSLDLIGSKQAVEKVFGLKIRPLDYFELFLRLKEHFTVIPHLTVGLDGGGDSGEESVIDFLAQHSPDALTFLVFRPTPKTLMAGLKPPSIERVVNLIDQACDRMHCPLHLGCMRPTGYYRRRLDPLAWLAGARTIVMPDKGLVENLRQQGIPLSESEQCCSLESVHG